MDNRLFKLACFLFVLALGSCSSTQKIATLRPEPDDATPLIYDNKPSFISMPVTIKLKDIENQTNKLLTGLIYEDNKIEDDDYTVKVWKQGPISLQNVNGKIRTVLPLKATVHYRYGIDKLGVKLYDTREINLNGVITLLSDVSMSNWKMKTATDFKSLEWKESPSVTIAGKSIAITYLINPAIKMLKAKIEKSIDETIAKSMDFKPNVLDALEQLCTPSQMSEEYDTWLRVNPVELYTTATEISGQEVILNMGMKCTIESLVGQKPAPTFDRNKIVLKAVSKMPDALSANIVAVSTYKDASAVMSRNFQGQEFGSGSKKVKVQKVGLWHKNGKMVIALDLIGSVNGTIYLAGFPQYNEQTMEIYFDQLDYALETKSALLKTANWLGSGMVLRKIQENCRYSIKPNLDEGRQNMLKYMKNYSPMPGVFVNGSLKDIEFKEVQLTNKAIIALLAVNGRINIKVDGLQ
jgi:hypothetical protein